MDILNFADDGLGAVLGLEILDLSLELLQLLDQFYFDLLVPEDYSFLNN